MLRPLCFDPYDRTPPIGPLRSDPYGSTPKDPQSQSQDGEYPPTQIPPEKMLLREDTSSLASSDGYIWSCIPNERGVSRAGAPGALALPPPARTARDVNRNIAHVRPGTTGPMVIRRNQR